LSDHLHRSWFTMEVVGRKKYCCKYPGCNNWYFTNVPEDFVKKHFFRFPKDPHYHQLWRNICKIDISTSSTYITICEDHFVDSDFVNVKKNKLNPDVVPVAPNGPSEMADFSFLEDLPFQMKQIEVKGHYSHLWRIMLPVRVISHQHQGRFAQVWNQMIVHKLKIVKFPKILTNTRFGGIRKVKLEF
jgi:hypothetical protein